MSTCKICKQEFKNNRSFATHLQRAHKIKSIDYTIQYLYDGIQPMCPICGEETRYVKYGFKKYCKQHANIAASEGGERGGKAQAWNKGLTKKTDERIRIQAEKQFGTNNSFYGKKHTQESIQKMKKNSQITKDVFNTRLEMRNNKFNVLTSYEEYFSRQHQYLDMICVQCGALNKKTLQAFERLSTCDICEPNNVESIGQMQIREFCESLLGIENVLPNSRTAIAPYEIDIYIPSAKLGIEYHGLYWHSEHQKEKDYHKIKADRAQEVGISLFQIFSDEWEQKQELIKSMIKYRLGLVENKIGARKLNIVELSSKQRKEFFNVSHISGDVQATKSFGLVDENGNVLSAISLRKPFHKKYDGAIEIARFATLPGYSISGGFQRLLKSAVTWIKSVGFDAILTYADRRIGNGETYEKAGFKLVGQTPIDYSYSDGIERFNRFKFRAQNNLTERQVTDDAGVFRVYGAGNNIYLLYL